MLVAQRPTGERVEADRDLPPGVFVCPWCTGPVVLKPGRVKVAHFAHAPGASCDWAGESAGHRLAKRVLADRFRELGYTVELEEPHPTVGRRVDVAVTCPTGHRVAIEVQDSAIDVDEMKHRTRADQHAGFFATVWVFTSSRGSRLLDARGNDEVRVPDEIRWVHDRYGQGVFVIDERSQQMWQCHLEAVTRVGGSSEWYEPGGVANSVSYSDRTLKTTKTVTRTETGFSLARRRDRYHKPTVVFAD